MCFKCYKFKQVVLVPTILLLCRPLVLEHASPSTQLLEKRRQMFEVQEALELEKQEFARKVRSA